MTASTTTESPAVSARDVPCARTVADAMITEVKVSGPAMTVQQLRALFDDDHVHAAVIVDNGKLLGVVDRFDVATATDCDDAQAIHLARRAARVVAPHDNLEQVRRTMLASGRRRLAVVEPDGRFRGLLCLKRTRLGFCSDQDVRARAAAGSTAGMLVGVAGIEPATARV